MAVPRKKMKAVGLSPGLLFAREMGKHGWVFYAAVAFMLAFFAAGAVHELVPGLCHTDADGDEECAFCFLVHVPWVALLAICLVFSFRPAVYAVIPRPCPCLCRLFTPAYSLRAPPAR